jgi:hypothetical protein
MPQQFAKLRIHASRAGTVLDAAQTLTAIDDVYLQLYAFDVFVDEVVNADRIPPRFFPILESGFLSPQSRWISPEEIRKSLLLPGDELIISAVRFESPGFWEVVGAWNPLEQIRKYLKDHREHQIARMKAKAEAKSKDIRDKRDEVKLFREAFDALVHAGFSKAEARRRLLAPEHALSNLGAVQDRGLIEDAEIVSEDNEKKAE